MNWATNCSRIRYILRILLPVTFPVPKRRNKLGCIKEIIAQTITSQQHSISKKHFRRLFYFESLALFYPWIFHRLFWNRTPGYLALFSRIMMTVHNTDWQKFVCFTKVLHKNSFNCPNNFEWTPFNVSRNFFNFNKLSESTVRLRCNLPFETVSILW